MIALLLTVAVCGRAPFTVDVSDADRNIMDAAWESYQAGDNLSTLHYCHEFLIHTSELKRNPELDSTLNLCYRLLGNVHFMYHDYGRSLRCYEESLKISRSTDDKEAAAKIISNMALAACYMHDSLQARRYIRLADRNPVSDPEFESFLKHIRHAIYERAFADWQKSIEIMKTAYIEARNNGRIDPRHQLTPVSEIFQTYEEHGVLDSALVYLERYRQLASDFHVPSMLVDAERGYRRIYQNIPDKSALLSEHINRYFEIRDSAFDTDSFLKISDQYQRELDRKERSKIKTLQFQVSRLQLMIWALALIILIGAVIYFWSRNSRRRRKAYGVVYESNREMAQSARREHAEATREEGVLTSQQGQAEAAPGPDAAADTESAEETTDTDCPDKQRHATEASTEELGKRIEEVMESSDKWLDPDFSISSLASLAGVNAKYVSACINNRYGKNFRTFINEYRIHTALRRMSDTENYGNYTIGAIAESVGFRSSTNFIAAFKKLPGVTPSHYLRLAKE